LVVLGVVPHGKYLNEREPCKALDDEKEPTKPANAGFVVSGD